MIRLDGVTLRRGKKALFDSASLTIYPGQKVGLTGHNGSGKSSLFSMLLGELEADEGSLRQPPGWEISHVAQQTPSSEASALDYVIDGDAELRRLQRAIEVTTDGHQQGELHAKLEAIDGYRAETRAARLLHGLGFESGEGQNAVNTFSGGWKMRLNLARALMCRSDLLLLDEPTNHLDLDAVIWLEQWLRQYPGTLILISHDRDFLDSVADHILHIEQLQLNLYSGNYSAFEKIRAERLACQQSEYEKQQREIAHMQKFVDRFRAKATKAKQAQSRLNALEKMTLIAPAHVDSPFHFSFLIPEKQPNPLLVIDNAAAGYADTKILERLKLTIHPGDRIGLLGPNGAGKSTLIKLLAASTTLQSGERIPAKDCHIGYFAQHQLEQLQPTHSPFEHLRQIDPLVSDQQARNFLGGFGFQGDRVFEPVEPFSGGEKARLALSLIVYQRPNLLLLDEPTNHLDIEMRQALAQSLQEFEGAMIIVSHDRFLLRATCDQLWLVYGGGVDIFDGDLDSYPRWLAAREAEEESGNTTSTQKSATTRREQKREEAERRKQLRPLKLKIEKLEKEMAKLTSQQEAFESRLADVTIYEEPRKAELSELLSNKSLIDKKLVAFEEEWLDTCETLEAASSDLSSDQ